MVAGRLEKQVSPLRCASVEMTEVGRVEPWREKQVSPLRFASVEMTELGEFLGEKGS